MKKRLLIITGERSGLESILPAVLKTDQNTRQSISIVATDYSSVPLELRSNIMIPSTTGLNINPELLSMYLKTLSDIINYIKVNAITDILFVDNPEFNLLLSRILHTMGNKLYYFIIPQVWAWRYYRINYLKKYFNKVFVIFPFEEELLKRESINVKFVGHPKYEQIKLLCLPNGIKEKLGINPKNKVISLFPGTRESILKRQFDIFENSAHLLAEKLPNYRIVISDIRRKNTFKKGKIIYTNEKALHILSISNFAIISSGSTTMEAAFLNVPFLGIYIPDLLTYSVGRILVKLNSTLMPNILLNERFIPELVSPYLSQDEIVKACYQIITNKSHIKTIKKKLSLVSKPFEGYTTSEIMSEEIKNILTQN
ncbi:MAG: hypothetical protein N2746_03295 [Deltaproteobacteria bacterium]|nr:hypothetical protein [Deltaproteobacteria bacterium]